MIMFDGNLLLFELDTPEEPWQNENRSAYRQLLKLIVVDGGSDIVKEKMALSKPIYSLMETYFEQLYTHPIRTKCINSCVIAVLGNLTFQYLSGNKVLNQDSLIAYGLYGLLFGGSIPHYFYKGLDGLIPYGSSHRSLKQLAVERFIFMPLYQAFSLYMLARLEGKSHNEAMGQLLRIYGPTVKANWIWLTIVQYLNLRLVPPMLRVLFANLIGFFWIIYLAKRRQTRERKGNKQ